MHDLAIPRPALTWHWLLVPVSLGLALALAVLPLSWAIALAVGGVGFGVIVLSPIAGLALLALAVPFGHVQTVPVAGALVSGVDAVLAILTIVWCARAAAHRQTAMRPIGVLGAGVIFVLLAALSVQGAATLAPALKETVKWLEFTLVVGLAGSLARRPQDVAVVLGASAIAAVLSSVQGWYQFLFRVGPESFLVGERFLRAYGTFGQPNPFAGYLGIVLLPLLALLVGALLDRAPDPRSLTPVLPLLFLAGICSAIGAGILMSFSRGSWLGLAVAAAVGLALLHRRGVAILVGAAGLVAALSLAGSLDLLPATIAGRLGSVTESIRVFDARDVEPTAENWASVERMANWQAAWAMFETFPTAGVGLGNFGAVYPDYALPAWKQYPAPHAHNYYLNLLAETGIVGLFGYGILMAAALTWTLLVWHRCARSGSVIRLAGLAVSSRVLAAGVVAVVVYVWTHSLLDDLFVHGITVQVALSLGILAPLADAASAPAGSR